MNRKIIRPTPSQIEHLKPLFDKVRRHGGSLMAQVFSDYIHVVHLQEDLSFQVAAVTGTEYLPKTNSGLVAFNNGVERDKKGGTQ